METAFCCCWAAIVSLNDCTSAAVTVGWAGAAAAARLFLDVVAVLVWAHAPAANATRVRVVNSNLVAFIGITVLSFWDSSFCRQTRVGLVSYATKLLIHFMLRILCYSPVKHWNVSKNSLLIK